ncbi:hypothetical protein K1719_019977 [Acacia pycnantha]|nr:hypothetical protein K1719_019977 [Acacia pycnantha]
MAILRGARCKRPRPWSRPRTNRTVEAQRQLEARQHEEERENEEENNYNDEEEYDDNDDNDNDEEHRRVQTDPNHHASTDKEKGLRKPGKPATQVETTGFEGGVS